MYETLKSDVQKVMFKREQQKRCTKETCIRDLYKRPIKETLKGDLQKSATKEMYQRDLHKRPIYETLKGNLGGQANMSKRQYRVAKTHRIPYLYRSFSAKVTYI